MCILPVFLFGSLFQLEVWLREEDSRLVAVDVGAEEAFLVCWSLLSALGLWKLTWLSIDSHNHYIQSSFLPLGRGRGRGGGFRGGFGGRGGRTSQVCLNCLRFMWFFCFLLRERWTWRLQRWKRKILMGKMGWDELHVCVCLCAFPASYTLEHLFTDHHVGAFSSFCTVLFTGTRTTLYPKMNLAHCRGWLF